MSGLCWSGILTTAPCVRYEQELKQSGKAPEDNRPAKKPKKELATGAEAGATKKKDASAGADVDGASSDGDASVGAGDGDDVDAPPGDEEPALADITDDED